MYITFKVTKVYILEYRRGNPVPLRQVLHLSRFAVVAYSARKYAQLKDVEGHLETEIEFSVAGAVAFHVGRISRYSLKQAI
jgi:hypothetical protein